jgi:hypothetical protein
MRNVKAQVTEIPNAILIMLMIGIMFTLIFAMNIGMWGVVAQGVDDTYQEKELAIDTSNDLTLMLRNKNATGTTYAQLLEICAEDSLKKPYVRGVIKDYFDAKNYGYNFKAFYNDETFLSFGGTAPQDSVVYEYSAELPTKEKGRVEVYLERW